mmetsp:Transcript_17242/g.34570  ORF Transcript_17242/g.34570 Transcript_17242/m.34570 type:complete len:282 (+) Transcript_17242:110-955(+)|eukprot:CAMPEP_0182473194 /NCGR_PEP_ID=MMETSP1319-20130603/23481_1 /TAXON_ID=172717 /ORGANISM="Bolidomonas pacifica, Strain RCC208" /LENGTH=281 /DNA_ID=CAMNT_0024673959 /DNA_START=72 /DNA_END=917 /DNA_ORIENTATION=-
MTTPPASGYGPLPCTLHRYHKELPLTLSLTPPPSAAPSTRCLILLGGLGDSYLPLPYLLPLHELLASRSIALCTPTLRSSGMQFGWCSLDTDVEDLDECMSYLSTLGYESFVLLGHSTGCQISVHYLLTRQSSPNHASVTLTALQAPVSDREGYAGDPKYLSLASEMVSSGAGSEFMPRACHWAPVTAARFADLYVAVGEGDDYFSSDLDDGAVEARLGGLKGMNVIAAYSRQDEYVPESVDKGRLIERWGKVGLEARLVEGSHNLKEGAGELLEWLKERL